MKLRTRITLQFSVIVTVILILFSIIVYSIFDNFRSEEFYERLENRAVTSVRFLSDVDEINNELLKVLDRNVMGAINDEKIYIYDLKDQLVYCSLVHDSDDIPVSKLSEIRHSGIEFYTIGDVQYAGVYFKGRYDHYVAVACGRDVHGLAKADFLKTTLAIGVVISVLMNILIGLFFSRQALEPLNRMIGQVDQITVANLGSRIETRNTNDELTHLAINFNKMLERLDAAFAMQRSFVSNASHELRTPLTALTGQLEVSLMNAKISSDARLVLEKMLEEIRQLNKLSNGLLSLAQSEVDDKSMKPLPIRLDELLGTIRAELLRHFPEHKVVLSIDEIPEEEWLVLMGFEQLLRSALSNIIENACKYSSDHTARVHLSATESSQVITVADLGIGIPESEKERIFEPFFRGENARTIKGHGIGLTLARRIVLMHGGVIDIQSTVNEGSTFRIEFNRAQHPLI